MLLKNQRLDKLTAAHVDFKHHGMLRSVQGSPSNSNQPPIAAASAPSPAAMDANSDQEDKGVTSHADVRFPKCSGEWHLPDSISYSHLFITCSMWLSNDGYRSLRIFTITSPY
jgi:hypothetical protein